MKLQLPFQKTISNAAAGAAFDMIEAQAKKFYEEKIKPKLTHDEDGDGHQDMGQLVGAGKHLVALYEPAIKAGNWEKLMSGFTQLFTAINVIKDAVDVKEVMRITHEAIDDLSAIFRLAGAYIKKYAPKGAGIVADAPHEVTDDEGEIA